MEENNWNKAIACGLPIKIRERNGVTEIDGWGATIYTTIFAPLEASINGGFSFYHYKGNYFKGLWGWLTLKE